MSSVPTVERPIVLHLGDEIEYNLDLFNEQLLSSYTITRPALDELTRPEFIRALTEKRWGNFSALMRPFWNTGGEMGHWDRELISLLPESCKVFASAGTGYDWADVEILAEYGMFPAAIYPHFYYTGGIGACVVIWAYERTSLESTYK